MTYLIHRNFIVVCTAICWLLFLPGASLSAQSITESFDLLNAPSTGTTYASGSYVGDAGDPWTYTNARTQAAGITGSSAELRKLNGAIEVTLSNGLGSLTFDHLEVDDLFKSILNVSFNGEAPTTYETRSQSGVVTIVIDDLTFTGTTTVRIANVGNQAILLDNVSWTENASSVPVTGITLNKYATDIPVGQSERLDATVSPANASDHSVTWISSDASVATVDETGLVTATGQGTAQITATAGEFTASCTVTVTPAAVVYEESFIRLNAPTASLADGSFTGDNGETWTYERAGTVLDGITGQSIELRKLNSTLTTTIPIDFDSLAFSIRTVAGGRDRSGKVQIIVGSDTLGAYGTVTSGVVETFLLTDLGATAGTTLTVNGTGFDNTVVDDLRWGDFPPFLPVTGVSIEQVSDTLTEGETVQLTATVLPADATEAGLSWSSTAPTVVRVDATGLVEAENPGTASVVVTTDDGGFTDTITFAVKELLVPDDLAIDGEGWSVFIPGPDSRIVYCSDSEGSDGNDGLSEATPVKTLDRATTLLRDGRPDHLYLKRGDVWTDQDLAQLGKKSGKNSFERMVVAYYGTGPRPLVRPNNTFVINAGVDDLAIIGIEFYNYSVNPADPGYVDPGPEGVSVGFRFVGVTVENLLFEDCKFSFFSDHMSFFNKAAGRGDVFDNIDLRRNIFVNAYQRGSTDEKILAQGMFVSHTADFLLEENFFDHNGWNEDFVDAQPNQFNHNVYLSTDNAGPMVVRGNVISRAAAHGVQLRSGGVAEHNAFIGNAIGMNMGFGSPPTYYDGPTTVANNVVTDGRPQIPNDFTFPQTGAVWGLWKQSITNLTVDSNIVANIQDTTGGNMKPYNDMAANDFGTGNIAWNWTRGDEPATDPGWLEPTRDKDSYATALGYGTYDDWVDAASNRGLRSFPTEFTARSYVEYIKEGFNVVVGPDLSVRDCEFTEEDFFGASEITAVGAITYADFSFNRGSYVIGIGTGIRSDGLAGAWEIHNDCTIETIRRTGQGDRITRLPDVRGVERNRGWRYLPTSISADGQYIYGTALNENGFTHARGWTIAPGTTVDIRWKLGGPFYGRIFGIKGSILCDDLSVITYAGNFFVTGCDDETSPQFRGAGTQVQAQSNGQAAHGYSIYPNPVSAQSVTVASDAPLRSISLIGVSGQLLRQLSRPSARAELDISGLLGGVYIVELAVESGGVIRERLIIN